MNDKRIVELALRGIDQEIEKLQREKATLSESAWPVTMNTTVKFKKAAPLKAHRKVASKG